MLQNAHDTSLADREIERYGLLDKPPGRELQALVNLIAEICEVQYAAINMVTSAHQHQIVTLGFEQSICAREDSMCAVLMDETSPVVVADASRDPRFEDSPFVNGEISAVRFYASAPIITADGLALGRLCIFDDKPRELSPIQRKALGVMATQVMDLLELRFRSQALEQSLQELTEVRDDLRQSNEHLTLFAGQVSHDLRTPLTAILINAELLSTEPVVHGNPEISDMVEAIDHAGRRMDTMIEEMLSFAQKGGHLRIVETELGQVVSLVLADVAPLVSRDNVDIRVDDLPRVKVDPDLLYSVLLNLVTNAIKFARPGSSPSVAITAERRGPHWRIRVTDDGIGVERDRQNAMFAMFARADKDMAGHGIGLATAKRIVEAHGGSIGMESPAGGGTSVWFDLPA